MISVATVAIDATDNITDTILTITLTIDIVDSSFISGILGTAPYLSPSHPKFLFPMSEILSRGWPGVNEKTI